MRPVILIGMAVLVAMAGCAGPLGGGDSDDGTSAGNGNGVESAAGDGGVSAGNGNGNGNGNGASVGYSVGGASDINNFRDNVQEGFLPIASDVTTEGVYKEYYFDRGQNEPCEQLFCPSYSRAVSADPIANTTEQYLTVGLNSGIQQSDLERPDLNLVVVVDESGSMDSPFDQYYYDSDGNRVETEQRKKMAAAKDAVGTLLGQLHGADRVGVVSFSDSARTVAEMQRVDERDVGAVRERVNGLRADGGTNLDAAMSRASTMASEYAGDGDRETRVVYVTDAMPNREATSTESLSGQLESHAGNDIYSTFVGVGVDFNTELTSALTDIEGVSAP